jgi:integrase
MGVASDPNGRKRVQFFDLTRKRQAIRLGKASQKQAATFDRGVHALLAARRLGQQPDRQTIEWLAALSPNLRAKLVKHGLADAGLQSHTVGELVAEFERQAAVKPGTLTTYRQTGRSMNDLLGADTPLHALTPLHADRFRTGLAEAGLATATISKRVKTARQAFKQALRWRWIEANPFADVRAGQQVNRKRQRFVSLDETQHVLDACPDAEWRLIVALARFGGLRCPSEVLALTWEDVQWSRDRFTVNASKTERHADGGVRQVPIFPELRLHLLDVFELADAGSTRVITRYAKGSNLNPQLTRIIKRAGLKPWPKVFGNLRASRSTELAASYPSHVAAAWLGHSQQIADLHYRQVTEADFGRAVEASQNPSQHGPASSSTERQAIDESAAFAGKLPQPAARCDSVPNGSMTPTGFEPVSPP